MRRTRFVRFMSLGLALSASIACGGGPTTTTPATLLRSSALPSTVLPSVVPPGATLPRSDVPTADALCAVFTEALAVAALGEPVLPPLPGDVVPRPNGVYCHYAAAAEANHNVEAQVNNLTKQEFAVLASALGMSEPLAGVGEQAYKLDRALLGGEGSVVLAWAAGRVVTIIINDDGNQAAMNAAATAIATAVLALS
ncbi:MAG: hypothetical protein ABIP53_02690 [Candidatus Limnocylindrales bacterium]